jgi:catechol 2,3-dioxygenase-like lactoylglutathione lyase family enzyme
VAEAPKENPHFIFLKSGADYVLLGRDAGRERFSDIIHHAFMVDGDAYDAAVAELKARGVDVFREEKRDQGVFTGRSAYFHDPDNNALEIIHLTNRAKGLDGTGNSFVSRSNGALHCCLPVNNRENTEAPNTTAREQKGNRESGGKIISR